MIRGRSLRTSGGSLFCLLVLVFSSIGCDSLWYVRMQVRDGPGPAVKVVELSELPGLPGTPIDGVEVRFSRTSDASGEWRAVLSGTDGMVEYTELGPGWGWGRTPVRFVCSKRGYVAVQGDCELAKGGWKKGRVVVVFMRRADDN